MMFVALIEQTSKCLAFLDKVFVDIASFWPRHDASFFASFVYKVMSRKVRTFELNFVHFILTPPLAALFILTSVEKYACNSCIFMCELCQ